MPAMREGSRQDADTKRCPKQSHYIPYHLMVWMASDIGMVWLRESPQMDSIERKERQSICIYADDEQADTKHKY